MQRMRKALLRGPAAVDRERGAADLRGGIRAEKKRERADLLRRDEFAGGLLLGEQTAPRLRLRNLFAPRELVDLLLHQRRQHPAGTDRVAGDAAVRGLQRRHPGHADEAVLSRDIGNLVRRGDQPMRRRDINVRPQPRCFICGSTALMVWKLADRLTASTASQRSSGNSSIGATCWMPALFTTMSTRPSPEVARSINRRTSAGFAI